MIVYHSFDVILYFIYQNYAKLNQIPQDHVVFNLLGIAYHDRLVRFQQATGRKPDDYAFSEKDLVNHFKGESREIKRYVLDAVRDGVTSDPDNKLRDFIDFGGRGKERPLSYSTIEKTFYSFFIYQEVLEAPIDYLAEEGQNPRQLEREQILRLMNLIAEEIYVGRFDTEIGTDKIENQIQKGEKKFPLPHLTAYRMSKEEIVYNWLQYAGQIATQYFVIQGKPDPKEQLFQVPFPLQIWENIRKFLQSLVALPLWVNTDLSLTVFGGKQNNSFWKTVFETGRTPQGMTVLVKPINLIDMIK